MYEKFVKLSNKENMKKNKNSTEV